MMVHVNIFGDTNKDGMVNVLDIIEIVNIITSLLNEV